MLENKMKRKLKSDKAVMCLIIHFVHPGLVEFLGRLGYDTIVVDAEHGLLSDNDVENFVRACELTGVAPLLRIPVNQPLMQRYLDIGVYGFHVPHVESAAQAREVINAVKYRPLGKRGTGLTRTTNYGLSLGSWTEYAAFANEQTFIKLSIEDPNGLAAVPEIAKMPEVDVISFGTGDIADSMGLPGQRHHPNVTAEVDKAIAIVRAAGKAPGLPTFVPGDFEGIHRRGARFITVLLTQLLTHGSRDYLDAQNKANH